MKKKIKEREREAGLVAASEAAVSAVRWVYIAAHREKDSGANSGSGSGRGTQPAHGEASIGRPCLHV